MRIATYNVEWFNALFDDEGLPQDDSQPSARRGVTHGEQLGALGIVFTAIDADMILVIEAPDQSASRKTLTALENFSALFGLRARRAVMGFANETQQEIAVLYDPYVIDARHDPRGSPHGPPGRNGAPRFDGVFRIDLDTDATADQVRFSKPPLELAVQVLASGAEIRVIGVHLKSKAPHGATSSDQVMRLSIANRRKQLAQAIWLRRRIDAELERGTPLIVMGDLNDGPGLDEFEGLFGRSTLEIVTGDAPCRALHDPHARRALHQRAVAAVPASARFFLAPRMRDDGEAGERYLSALLDYILVSPDLRGRARDWRIWHPFDDPGCWRVPELRDALLAASDHYPVTVYLDI